MVGPFQLLENRLISTVHFFILKTDMEPPGPKHSLSMSVVILGFATLVSQMLFMREFVVVFYGNELSLGALFAAWLFWTAAGSGWLPEHLPIRKGRWDSFRLLFALLACTIPLTGLAIYQSRIFLHAVAGEMIDYGLTALTGFIVFSPLCLLSGYAYASACRLVPARLDQQSLTASGVYALEALGSAAGGLLASFLLFPRAAQVQIVAAISGLVFLAGLSLSPQTGRGKKILVLVVVVAIGGFIFTLAPKIQSRLDRRFWRNGQWLASKNTAYGNITVTRLENQISFFENGIRLFTCPDPQAAEEAVHYALLENPSPEKILLIGGSLGGAIEQAFRHPSMKTVQVVELDPEIIRLAREYLPPPDRMFLDDPRVILHLNDARNFVNGTSETFDAILLNVPNPYTAQLNRFYTAEFFRKIRSKLNPGGVFSFQLPSSENAIGKEMSDFLSNVSATLSSVFPKTVLLPGDHCRFIASVDGHFLTSDPDAFARRIRDRNLKTVYVQDYFMASQFSKERRDYLFSRLHPVPPGQLNRDFKPLAFWYDLVIWSRYFTPGLRTAFVRLAGTKAWHLVAALLSIASLIVFKIRKNRSGFPAVRFSIFSVGFSGIALELMLLLMYQTFYGVLYQHMAVLVAGYMAGLGIGSLFARKRPGATFSLMERLTRIQILTGLLPLIAGGCFLLVHRSDLLQSLFGLGTLLFVALNTFAGFLGGAAFALANRVLFSSGAVRRNAAGSLYALDLLGSLLGALLTTGFAVPLLGTAQTLLVISALNLTLSFILWTSGRRFHRPRRPILRSD